MDKAESGVAVISSKKLEEAPPSSTKTTPSAPPSTHVYMNEAFDSNSYDKDVADTTVASTAAAASSTTTTATSSPNPANGSKVASVSPLAASPTATSLSSSVNSKTGQPGLYDDISALKKGHHHGSVEFSVPESKRRESRLKSISEGPYRGMGKEELLRFSSRPLWRNLRYACITIVLMGWLALLITVVALILTYPPCRSRDSMSTAWWQKSVFYRVYVPSFQDSEKGDGIGDIQGIRDRLDYIQEIGADTISLSPIYKLGSGDTDTDILDHTEIDPVYGTLAEFRMLLNDTHSRGMHLILDFVPNHTSKDHPWFVRSKSDPNARENEYRSFYVWTEGTDPINNWKTVYGCEAWSKEGNNSHYLHQFRSTQPDLNLRSDKVKDKLEDILDFWLDLGVDGFYIRDVDYLFEDYDMRDEELTSNSTQPTQFCGVSGNHHPYSAYNHKYTKGLNQNLDVISRWRAKLDKKGEETGRYRVLIADVTGDLDHVTEYYGLFNRDGVNFPLNLNSQKVNMSKGGVEVGGMVSDWIKQWQEEHKWANWMSGDDRLPRLADRMESKFAKAYLMLITLLPGTPFIYFGDEIGMQSNDGDSLSVTPWTMEQPMRTPMLWNNKTTRGFCAHPCPNPWMAPSDSQLDVESQKGNPNSILNLFRNLTSLRKDNPSFEYGDFHAALQDEDVYSFVREFDGEKGYLVAINFGPGDIKRDFPGTHSTIPGSASIEIDTADASRRGDSVGLSPLTLLSGEGIVVSWDYEAKEL